MTRRVAVTGLGLVTPLGAGVEHVWPRLLNGESGAGRIEGFEIDDLGCQIACQVPRTDGFAGGSPDMPGAFDPDKVMSPKEQRRVDDFILYAIAAADEAVRDAGWTPDDEESRLRTGVMIGSGIGGLQTIYDASIELNERGPRRISPFTIPSMLINLASGQVSIRYGFKGPNHSVVTACSTGAHAIGDASRLIKNGDADVMIAGGGESAITRLGIASFVACRALSTGFNDDPQSASRPYDQARDGFVMGEGAGIVVLEELEHAKARGATIYAEVIGYGATSDGHDMVAPNGEGAARCMRQALATVEGQVDYINAHGTSTPVGDVAELKAISEVFADNCPSIGSTKSLSGHSLGAAGVHEAIYSLLMMQHNFTALSANIETLDEKAEGLPILVQGKDTGPTTVLSNSFGFGGTNASLVLRKWEE